MTHVRWLLVIPYLVMVAGFVAVRLRRVRVTGRRLAELAGLQEAERPGRPLSLRDGPGDDRPPGVRWAVRDLNP